MLHILHIVCVYLSETTNDVSQRSPENREARRIPVVINVIVPRKFTRKTQRPVAKALPRPVFLMRKPIKRSKKGARLTANAKRGTLVDGTKKKQAS